MSENVKIKAVLFDLDGTLLPMDNDVFTNGYFKMLVKKMAPFGFAPQELIDGVWTGTAAMVKNNGAQSNCDVFWKAFAGAVGERVYAARPQFEDFYANEFNQAKMFCGFSEKALESVRIVKAKGMRAVLASNPIFPMFAQIGRLRWAGIEPEEFEHITAYENYAFSKPNPAFFSTVAEQIGLRPEECLMVGNDADEDGAAAKTGMQVFLLTDHLINRSGRDLSVFPHGDFEALQTYLANI
ncbi:MAG: HAD family hydrolase [Oscillospiraceae bacterium]|nr:HAD family hydrolase [Oscillospiraceae bacterium]